MNNLLNKEKLSIFGGTGFIGTSFLKYTNQKYIIQPRESRAPLSQNILYFISTTHNYNIFSNINLDVETNLTILCEVLNNCKNKNLTFNFISSWVVYGDCALPATEETICSPKGFYSITKKAAEDLLISFCKTFDVKFKIIRLCNVLGKGDSKSSLKKNAITHMISKLSINETITLHDNGSYLRDLLHIKDVCYAIDLICDLGEFNQIYNICSGHPTSIRDIIISAKNKLNSTSTILSTDSDSFQRNIQTKNIWMDNSKIKRLGFLQRYTLDDIINELCFPDRCQI